MDDIQKESLSSSLYPFRYYFFFGIILIIAAMNLTIDIMDIDAGQYAVISSEMAQHGSYLHVYERGKDYLDKPPLLFWLSSLSISILGNTNIGYKLPSVIMLMVALWATFSFSIVWYGRKTATVAVLILATTEAFHLMTNDVRTDGLLTAFVIISVWQISLYLKNGKVLHLLIGGLCVGAAMLAKGPIGMVIPGCAILGHLIITRQWKKIFDPAWLLVLLMVAMVLAPMCYGLYTQFDLHPEKEVYGLKGPSGLRFYFWTQSFGRITGESYWHNDTPFYYFIQTMLWDLQPWFVLFIPAFIYKIKKWWTEKQHADKKTEWMTLCGFIFPFIALSMSGYKLPHYVFPLFPFASVFCADFLLRKADLIPRWLDYVQILVIHLFFLMCFIILFFIFPGHSALLMMSGIIFYALYWWFRKNAEDDMEKFVFPSLTGILFFQLVMCLQFYPHLLKYQATSQAGQLIALEKPSHVYWYDEFGYGLDYYSGLTMPQVLPAELDTLKPGSWIYVSADGLDQMPPHKIIRQFDDFRVTLLNVPFLNPDTRHTKLKKRYLIELIGEEE